MVHTIVGYPSRGQAPEIPAMRLKVAWPTVIYTSQGVYSAGIAVFPIAHPFYGINYVVQIIFEFSGAFVFIDNFYFGLKLHDVRPD